MVKGVSLWRYSLPLQSPLILNKQCLNQRQGLLLQWINPDGVEWSEVCPLPGFSQETLADAQKQLADFLASSVSQLTELKNLDDLASLIKAPLYPSVNFGLEMGLFKRFHAKVDKHPQLPLAGLITDTLFDPVRFQPSPVVKVKVGRRPLAEDIERVNLLLRQLGPDKKLRLDANQSWTLAQAELFFANVPHQQIEFIEEPLSNPTNYQYWASAIETPFAFDEQVQNQAFILPSISGLSAIVLKPMLIGLKRSLELIAQAKEQNIYSVISSAYESSLTLNFLYSLASSLTPATPPGLDTFQQYQHDLIEPLSLPCGNRKVPLVSENGIEKVADYGF